MTRLYMKYFLLDNIFHHFYLSVYSKAVCSRLNQDERECHTVWFGFWTRAADELKLRAHWGTRDSTDSLSSYIRRTRLHGGTVARWHDTRHGEDGGRDTQGASARYRRIELTQTVGRPGLWMGGGVERARRKWRALNAGTGAHHAPAITFNKE